MKKYIKDGKIKFRNEIVVHRNGMQTINPSEEQIFADGWIEYTIPEPTEEEIFERAKRDLCKSIERYDSSRDVNGFYMRGQEMWLDKATRAGLMLRLQAEKSIGMKNTTLWYESYQFEISIDDAFQMLFALEVYASQCYDNTHKHLSAITELHTIDEIKSYDYRKGYPDKLEF